MGTGGAREHINSAGRRGRKIEAYVLQLDRRGAGQNRFHEPAVALQDSCGGVVDPGQEFYPYRTPARWTGGGQSDRSRVDFGVGNTRQLDAHKSDEGKTLLPLPVDYEAQPFLITILDSK